MKRLPLLLLAVGCWISVGVDASFRETWDKRSAEEGDCLVDCKNDHPTLSVQACLQKCKIGKRSTESDQPGGRPPPYEGPRRWPGKRSAEEGDCLADCKKDHPKLSIQACLQKCKLAKRSTEDEKLSAQDPPPQPWQVNGPGKRSAEQSRNYSDIHRQELEEEQRRYYEQDRIENERYNCTLGCRRMSEEFSRSLCLERCNNITKRSVSAQDPPPQPWQVNGPGKRSAEEDSCWYDCTKQGGHSANCASACQRCFPPQCTYGGHGKRSAEKLSAQDPPPQPWQVNGPGKRAAEQSWCLNSCRGEGNSWDYCLMRCHNPGKRSIEETRGL